MSSSKAFVAIASVAFLILSASAAPAAETGEKLETSASSYYGFGGGYPYLGGGYPYFGSSYGLGYPYSYSYGHFGGYPRSYGYGLHGGYW